MIRNRLAAVSLAGALGLAFQFGCGDDTKLAPLAGKDGSTNTGGSDSGSAGASGTAGTPGDGSSGGPKCGNVFSHTGACKTCLESNCCALGTDCGNEPDCAKLVDCVHGCDDKTGTAATTCVSACTNQYLTANSKAVYNPLIQCMGTAPCLSACPFRGP